MVSSDGNPNGFRFAWLRGKEVPEDLLAKCAALYSQHYGRWDPRFGKSGSVALSVRRLKELLQPDDSWAAMAMNGGEPIAYAFVVRAMIPQRGPVDWITQLVVHSNYRNQGIAKRLLASIWGFSNPFGWGLVTASPYAVRALEKATRRRCDPERIAAHAQELVAVGASNIPYIDGAVSVANDGTIDTRFYLEHSRIPEMVRDVVAAGVPWVLGPLADGHEWFAFTFREQSAFRLTREEWQALLADSNAIANEAYERMLPQQPWTRHAEPEVKFAVKSFGLDAPATVLDFGCGNGRHALELGQLGFQVVGIDRSDALLEQAEDKAIELGIDHLVAFFPGDCRAIDLRRKFDAGLCLYDVVGSSPSNDDNLAVLSNLARHIKPGGRVLISTMNMELTRELAKHRGSISANPELLMDLPASSIMEETGDVFDPEHYLLDEAAGVVYRKEQFTSGPRLPAELIVVDRRYERSELADMCSAAGFVEDWSRYVQAGRWDVDLGPLDKRAKEILYCGVRRE